MNPQFLKPQILNPGDKKVTVAEKTISNINFKKYKFNGRKTPTNIKDVLIICCFSEFGCEIVGNLYCLPKLLRNNPSRYIIIVGWHGREYLYRHLVDEFWEIGEEHMWLREYARAFHHKSSNLTKLEEELKVHGSVFTSSSMGAVALGVYCRTCKHFWTSTYYFDKCPKCKSESIEQSFFGDVQAHKPNAVKIPKPSREKMEFAGKFLKKNPVGIFARDRKCYGRNLPASFYIKLINSLESKGYNPIWMGEKSSTLACPVDHILDYSRMPEAADLETTFAITKQLKFTVQFWTASTRLASVMGVPFILFESPDQIWGNGQEGFRLNLCDLYNKKKLVLSHFLNILENHESGIELVEQAVSELEQNNFDDIFGNLESEKAARDMKASAFKRIGG